MILTASAAQGLANRRRVRLPNGGEIIRSVFLGAQDKPSLPDPLQPQFYMVEQLPHCLVEPHYHAVEQWQIIVAGTGTLGRHAASPVAVHYVDPYTGYGPIIAGDQGLTYYTVRAKSDPGAQFLGNSAAREKLKRAPRSKKRYLFVDSPDVSAGTRAELASRKETAADAVVPMHDDGMAAWLMRIAPHGDAFAPEPGCSGGQGLIVITGSMVHEQAELSELSCAFVPASSAALRLCAGSSGAEILVLQFPRDRAARPH